MRHEAVYDVVHMGSVLVSHARCMHMHSSLCFVGSLCGSCAMLGVAFGPFGLHAPAGLHASEEKWSALDGMRSGPGLAERSECGELMCARP